MSPYISGFLIFLIISLFLGAFFSLLYTDRLKLNDESLDKQPLFWFAVLSPIVLFLIFGVIIWKDYIPDLSKAGLENFARISTFPLAILTLSPIFGVIVSNIHKSIQTEKQIEQSEIKGRIDSFNAHYKFITDRISEIKERKMRTDEGIKEFHLFHSSNLSTIYRAAFPKSTFKTGYNNDTVSAKYIERIKLKINDVANVGVLSLDEIKLIRSKIKKAKSIKEKIIDNLENQDMQEKQEIKDIANVIFNKERKKALNSLFLTIGIGKNKEFFIDFVDANNEIKRYTRIIVEYSNMYLKLYSYTNFLLNELEAKNKIIEPYLDIVKKTNENQEKQLEQLKEILNRKNKN